MTCTAARFTGEVEASPSPSQKINAEYNNCTEFGFIEAEFRMNSCYYEFTAEATDPSQSGNSDYGVGSMHIGCSTPGDSITLVAGPCTIHVPPQTLSGMTYHATTSPPGTIDSVFSLSGIKSTVTSGFLCPLEEGEDETGTYTGTTEMSASAGSLGLEVT